jgi:hypothetical protein
VLDSLGMPTEPASAYVMRPNHCIPGEGWLVVGSLRFGLNCHRTLALRVGRPSPSS